MQTRGGGLGDKSKLTEVSSVQAKQAVEASEGQYLYSLGMAGTPRSRDKGCPGAGRAGEAGELATHLAGARRPVRSLSKADGGTLQIKRMGRGWG